MLTPTELAASLKAGGREVSVRQLTDWRSKKLLPPLYGRGRGRGIGKIYFWRYPKIFEQACAVDDLLKLNFSADEVRLAISCMGFSVPTNAIRKSWLKLINSAEAALENKRRSLRKKHGLGFYNPEDEASDIVTPRARREFKSLGIGRETIKAENLVQVVIDLFRAWFDPTYETAQEDVEALAQVASWGLYQTGFCSSTDESSDVRYIKLLLHFLVDNCSWSKTEVAINSATDQELLYAHRRWCVAMRLASEIWPELDCNNWKSGELPLGHCLAGALGKLIIPVLINWVKAGNGRKIDHTLICIQKFINSFDPNELKTIFLVGNMDQNVKIGVRELLLELSELWGWHDFPFIPATFNLSLAEPV